MKTAIVTDVKYRAAIVVARALGKAGYRVVLVQAKGDCKGTPAAFSSRFATECRYLEGSVKDEGYGAALLALIRAYDRPLLFCIGADTLRVVAEQKESFSPWADFLVADPWVLAALNDKEQVRARAEELGILTPIQYEKEPKSYPAVVKPRCGERFGLKASQRYAIVNNPEEFARAYAQMQKYDPAPLVQQKVEGAGIGACLLMGKEGELLAAYCHRRIREYPISGGPSCCCESFYDEQLIQSAHRLLASFGFCGLAMVEFKGEALLEVNPRLWGSYPLAEQIDSSFTARYGAAALGQPLSYRQKDYRAGVKMRFVLNDTLSLLSYLKAGRFSS